MKTRNLSSGLAALLMVAAMSVAHAGTIVSLVGDKDGFGLGLMSGEGFDYSLIGDGATDAQGTDVWHDGNFTYVHDYALSGTVSSASLELFSGGWGLGGAASLFLNGSFVGHLTNGDNSESGPVFNYAFKDVFDLTPLAALLTGHDTFEVRLVAGDDDSGALDYSQLTVNTVTAAVPEPSTFALFGVGLWAAAAAKRRRRA